MSHHDDAAEHVYDLIKDQRTAMLTTVHDEGGTLASRPMGLQDVDRDGTLWFLAFSDSEKAEEIRRRPDVNVAFTDEGKWVSVAGRASVTQDPARARELWNDFAQAWFQCEPEDPRVSDPGRRRQRRVLGLSGQGRHPGGGAQGQGDR